jgi:hypothetical protein
MNAIATQGRSVDGGEAESLPLVGLLFVQLLVGYEWFVSGLTKVVRSGFPGGLAES